MQCIGSGGSLRRWRESAGTAGGWSRSLWAIRAMAQAKALVAVPLGVFREWCSATRFLFSANGLPTLALSEIDHSPSQQFIVVLGKNCGSSGKRSRAGPARLAHRNCPSAWQQNTRGGHPMTDKKVWLITGAGRGLGLEIAKAALAAGHAVIATGREPVKVTAAIGQHNDLLALK